MHRRDFVRQAAVLGGALLLGSGRAEERKDLRFIRSSEPLCLEFPFATLKDFLTPTGSHYVRNHYAIPKIDTASFRLSITGAVTKPITLTLDELKRFKATTRAVTLECAGNGRSFFPVKVKGVQWAQGAVSTAEWTGVRLSEVLARAGVARDAVDLVLDSTDKGDPRKEGQPPGLVSYARSLPVAIADEVLLAYAMNGEPLPPAHGFPLRAVVPGWYGCASVKWLSRVIATRERFDGFDQTIDYSYWRTGDDGLPRLTPISAMLPKAQIAVPVVGTRVTAGETVRVFGAAWSGEKSVTSVKLSADGGTTWDEAKFLDPAVAGCWRRWEWSWKPTVKGETTLMARARDAAGQEQPFTHDPGRRSYMINFVQKIGVTVV